MTARLLPLPDDARLQRLIEDWPLYERSGAAFPRTLSSRDLSLTARHYFPGYLAQGHDVP